MVFKSGMWWVMLSVSALAGAVCVTCLPCEQAQVKCAYRVGCGMALQNYMMGCSAVLQGPHPTYCPEICQHSLIALTSTEEGKELMNCECSDDYCEDQKRRTEICRPAVLKSISQPVVSCRVAQWICAADALCSTALDYYNRFCRSMFHGKKCTPRCNNSIAILRRQEKAAKLKTCRCDGLEDYDCRGIQKNMDKLCFHNNKHSRHHESNTTRVSTSSTTERSTTMGYPDEEEPSVILYGSGVSELLGLSVYYVLGLVVMLGLVT